MQLRNRFLLTAAVLAAGAAVLPFPQATHASAGGDASDVTPAPAARAGADPEAVPPGSPPGRLTVRAGDTLLGLLGNELDLDAAEAMRVVQALSGVMDAGALRPGQTLVHVLDEDGGGPRLRRLSIRTDADTRVLVSRTDGGGLEARERRVAHRRTTRTVRMRVDGGLYPAAMRAGIPEAVLIAAYRRLSGRIDFQRDLRRGDEFAVVYERFVHEDSAASHDGRLLAARIGQAGGELAVFRPGGGTDGGRDGFYTADGASVATSLLRTPVKGARLSSLFGRRDHPVLGYTRMHEGLDFAAPRGTAVRAAGDGRVVRAGPFSSYGNYVRIRHDNRLQTAYAHLSAFADGIGDGDRVRQGEVIGYVGATGTATGPNLHYEVLRGGEPVDPRALDLPPRRRLTGERLRTFRERIRPLRVAMHGGARNAAAAHPALMLADYAVRR
ncbi:Murein DD-endopeptidase MepM [wastewater metagenome]|uniref:Murein DD-endopeptidase MepM n=2 Tax=unclassified sequences TaxID=12908 RepID=A0A5B8R979_9ZZZZ|nr:MULTISPECIES: M23 family metallopeptidase [Arhodomonas]MCS4505133.1 M23 family metallopeptidase [Arhodomonas aquaeolei]QEA04034.1 murein DD-endopeptidase MepM [uncultured organism]